MRVLAASLSMCLALLCVWAVAAAAGTDPSRAGTPTRAASEEQKAQIAELEKLLEEARKLKLAIEAGEGEKGAAKAEAATEKSPRGKNQDPVTPATRPGCMYRGNELLWEKRTGSCSKSPPR
jgi:hypothetical protein